MLALRLAARELRGSAGGFVLLLVGIAFGTAAIAAIGLLSVAVLDEIRDGARASIGGDISLRLFHRPPVSQHLAAFKAAGTVSLTAELRTLARRDDHSALVELKAVDDAYPLYGAVRLDPPLAPAEALGQRDGVWGAAVAASLLSALDAKIGDTVTVGENRFALRALIADEPDRALRAFSLGPRMVVALPALAGSDLVAPGAQVYWYSRIRLREGVDAGPGRHRQVAQAVQSRPPAPRPRYACAGARDIIRQTANQWPRHRGLDKVVSTLRYRL